MSRTPARRNQTMRASGPDDAGDVLREHRGHLGLQSEDVADPDPHPSEDPLPAEDEEQVVDVQHRESDRDVDEVGVADERERVRPDVPQDVGEDAQQDREDENLDRDDHAAPP